jgi:hypothetical protein
MIGLFVGVLKGLRNGSYLSINDAILSRNLTIFTGELRAAEKISCIDNEID